MASTTQDDAFREIQLSGKQLVFIFMAVVVIGVGVFLMGVQVGRGVLSAKGAPGTEVAAATEAEPPPPPASASPASTTTPATAGEKLSYAERLSSAEPPKEPLKADAPPAEPPTPKAETTVADAAPAKPEPKVATPAPAPPPAAAKATPAPAAPAVAEPSGNGFAIQVAALKEPDEANAIVKRLAGKGYPAYVVTPPKGAPSMYRVRVGKYKDRREADTVAAKLEKEEQFKPWIVR